MICISAGHLSGFCIVLYRHGWDFCDDVRGREGEGERGKGIFYEGMFVRQVFVSR